MVQSFLLTTVLLTIGMVLQQRDLINSTLAEQEWQHRANHDALTGLMNRNSFIPLIEHEILRSQRHQSQFTIVMLDIECGGFSRS